MINHDSNSPEKLLHQEIYDSLLVLAELAEEQNRGRIIILWPEVLEPHGYGDNIVMMVRHRLGYSIEGKDSNAEYSAAQPEFEIDIFELRKPLFLHENREQVVHELRKSSVDSLCHDTSDLLVERRQIRIPAPGNLGIRAEQKSILPIKPGDLEGNINRYINSLELQHTLGLSMVNIDNHNRLRDVFARMLRDTRDALDVDKQEELFGKRATQQQMRGMWKAAHDLLRSSATLYIPAGLKKDPDMFQSDNSATSVGEPHREHTYAYQQVSTTPAAGTLGVIGPVTVRNTYMFCRKGYKMPSHPATLSINFPVLAGDGEQMRVINVRESVLSGLRIARVDGMVPRQREDGAVDSGRHLTAEECQLLQELLTDLRSDSLPAIARRRLMSAVGYVAARLGKRS